MFDFNKLSYSYGVDSARLRKMYEHAGRDDGPATQSWLEATQAERNNIDMRSLEKKVVSIATYAAVLLRAFEYLEEPNMHPLTAFVRASRCSEIFNGDVEPISDDAFIVLMSQWRALCVAAKPVTPVVAE